MYDSFSEQFNVVCVCLKRVMETRAAAAAYD